MTRIDMTRGIRSEILLRIEAIPWFAHCGEPFHVNLLYPVRQVSTWKHAERCWTSQTWEDAQLDAKNCLTVYIGTNYETEFHDWNDLVDVAKAQMQTILYPSIEKFAEEHNLNRSFISTVEWDILIAIMEDTYLDCNPPQVFSLELLKVYEAGHMPCGWTSGCEWPEGKLIVL